MPAPKIASTNEAHVRLLVHNVIESLEPDIGRSYTVADLALRAEMDIEEVLVTLWYADIEYVSDPRSAIRSDDLNTALRACGLAGRGDRRKKAYWSGRLGLELQELEQLLVELGCPSERDARNIPKGAAAKLERVAASSPPAPTRVDDVTDAIPHAPPIVWRVVGQKRATSWLTVEEVESIHEALENDAAEASDPIWPPGVKSQDSLASALLRPQTGQGVEPKYPTIELAGAALVHSLVHNHPFHNGNKRTAVVALLVFLDRHNQWLRDSVDKEALFKWILEVTNHKLLPKGLIYDRVPDREVLEIAEWIRRNSRPISRVERPIVWRQLKAILEREFGCKVEPRATGVVIRRPVIERGFLRRRKTTYRTFQFVPGGDGREVGLGTVKKMRQALHLDQQHEVDSVIFYGDERSPDEFIRQYRSLLRALARV